MRFGICANPGSFPARAGETPAAALRRGLSALRDDGADYIEFTVSAVFPEGSAQEFDQLYAALDGAELRVEAFNSFIPKHHSITGPSVNLERVLAYCRVALERCKAVGADVVVLGSAGARTVPDGFDHARGEAQFVEFCRALDPMAVEIGIDIAIEPLNGKEDNLVRTVEHGIRLVDTIKGKRIHLLADLYHMSEDKGTRRERREGRHAPRPYPRGRSRPRGAPVLLPTGKRISLASSARSSPPNTTGVVRSKAVSKVSKNSPSRCSNY